MTEELPQDLHELLMYAFPDAISIDATEHSYWAWTIEIRDQDRSLYLWRACLSFDDRWTLSPARYYDSQASLHLNDR